METNDTRANSACCGEMMPEVHGMIDANAYHSGLNTWPSMLAYIQENGKSKTLKDVVVEDFPKIMLEMATVETGDYLVDFNTEMYNKNNGKISALDKNNAPSLIIAATMDMMFAHIRGYMGEFVCLCNKDTDEEKTFAKELIESLSDDSALAFPCWEEQITGTETVAKSNPLRYFPLFSYDPRRYRYAENIQRATMLDSCGSWNEPFERIVGCESSADGINKIWLGFCMNPALGFRPFDEFCEYLPTFYKRCASEKIPVLARCAPEGITAYDAKEDSNIVNFTRGSSNDIITYSTMSYRYFKLTDRAEKCNKRHKKMSNDDGSPEFGSSTYRGKERVVDDADLNDFYMNYGHPRNWIPVLKHFSDLRLCLAGFGGNREWQHPSMSDWATEPLSDDKNDRLPPREWIRCIIKLTQYGNVYADISGLNIYNTFVWFALRKMLCLIQNGHPNFKHLKYKLIFGSGWYLTDLMDMSNCTAYSSHNYNNYCREFRKLFHDVDKTGELWERVSLVNPWKFYGLDNKIGEIHKELQKNTDRRVNCDMLEKMNDVYNYTIIGGKTGLIKYVASRMENDPTVEPKIPDEKDEDLAAFSIDLRSKVTWMRQKGKKDCYDTCKKILMLIPDLSDESALWKDRIQIAKEKSNARDRNNQSEYLQICNEETKEGLTYLDQQLENGYPVIVGVDHTYKYDPDESGRVINSGEADHFIVIVGRGYNGCRAYYRFYDVGADSDNGVSDNNKLYLNGDLSLRVDLTYKRAKKYFVTQIRKNVLKKEREK